MIRGKVRSSKQEETNAISYFKSIFAQPAEFPFSFTYNGVKHVGFADPFLCELEEKDDESSICCCLKATHPEYRLMFRVDGTYYKGYGTYEWVVYCKNVGNENSGRLTDLQTVYCRFDGANPVLHHCVGDDPYYGDLYRPYETALTPGLLMSFAPMGGRSCAFAWPYYKLEFGNMGRIIAIGWSGGWKTDFRCDEKGITFSAQQQYFDAYLLPDEEIRTPSIVFTEYEGRDTARATNLWRRWMLDKAYRHPYGKDYEPKRFIFPHLHWLLNETNAKEAVEYYEKQDIDFNVLWIDAAWYRKNPENESVSRWEEVGEQVPDGTTA